MSETKIDYQLQGKGHEESIQKSMERIPALEKNRGNSSINKREHKSKNKNTNKKKLDIQETL